MQKFQIAFDGDFVHKVLKSTQLRIMVKIFEKLLVQSKLTVILVGKLGIYGAFSGLKLRLDFFSGLTQP